MNKDDIKLELSQEILDGPLCNPDIAPTPMDKRTWGMLHIAALWVGMSVCIPTYMLAANMIKDGLNWWESICTILIGNIIVLIPLAINAHAGTKYGIPFPVYARSSFGTLGAHIPSILRSLVACGWFGIQTWIGGLAINSIFASLSNSWVELGNSVSFMGHPVTAFIGFIVFWFMNMFFIWSGTEKIKKLETLAAPFLIIMGLALLGWAIAKTGGIGVILQKSEELRVVKQQLSFYDKLLQLFIPYTTAMVGFWATLSLNIPDFTRYAKTQKDQIAGQAVGLLTTMPLFSFIGVIVTSATVYLYGKAIWDPIELTQTMAGGQSVIVVPVMVVILIATLSTNIAANVVSPANSISNLAPQKISFTVGGTIAGLLGIFIMPWKLLGMYVGWLIGYSGLLGAVGGVIICDYVLIRGCKLQLEDLYKEDGEYSYQNGVNYKAVVALVAGILVALSGKIIPKAEFLFSGAWFSAAIVSFVVYSLLMNRKK